MHIVFVYDFAFIKGGAAKVAVSEAVEFANRGYEVTYFSAVGPVDSSLNKANVRIICLGERQLNMQIGNLKDKIHGAIQGVWNMRAKRAFEALLEDMPVSDTIIHIHGWANALSPAIFAVTAKKRFPIIITAHDYELICPSRNLFIHSQNQVCPYKPMSLRCIHADCDSRSYVQKLYRIARYYFTWHILRKNVITVIYVSTVSRQVMEKYLSDNCAGFTIMNPVEIPEVLNIGPEGNKKYLFIGRLDRIKGARMFCEAVSMAGVPAIVIGDGEELEELRREYQAVEFTGWLSREAMIPYILQTRCMIMSSQSYETGPLTVTELQCAYAIPCIVADKCGVSQTVKQYQTGLIFNVGDMGSLINCIERSKDNQLVATMSRNCRDRYNLDEFSVEEHVNKMLEVYQEVLSNAQRRI